MDIGSLRALVLSSTFGTFGVAATVRRPYPDEEPIVATGIWVTQSADDVPAGGDWARRGVRRVMALRHSEVPTVPKGTTIVAVEPGGTTPVGWRVDGIAVQEAEHVRVIVVRDPDLDLLLDLDD